MVFEYSYAWIIPAFIVALAVAYLKFRKLSKLPDVRFGIGLLISGIRFLALFTLLFLLLNPAISLLHGIKEKPILIIAQDNSLSLVKSKDSLYYLNEYRESLEKACRQLEEKYEIVRLTFGDKIRRDSKIDFSESRTDIAGVMNYASRHFISRSPEAMVLLTDGIYNSGVNPLYESISFPVYTVLLGDTTCYPDIAIESIEADKFNFIHTIFPIKVELRALKQNGKKVKCVLKENGNQIGEKILDIRKDNFFTEVNFQAEARQKGIVRYTVSAEPVSGEYTIENNKAETRVNIIDNTGEVALYSSAPHPDVAAIVQAINVSQSYRCVIYSFDKPADSIKSNLIIFHNPDPGNPVYRHIVQEAEKRKLSLWYILTNRENIANFARYDSCYTVDFRGNWNEYATIALNKDFPFFEVSDQETGAYNRYPPLVLPFGEIRTGGGRMLFTQKIKNSPTSNGLLGFYEINGHRKCYFWGEGLWRWRLYSYRENGDHELFNALIYKIVNYLAIRHGSERFIHDFKMLYESNEEVLVNVALYNESYESVNAPEVHLDLRYKDKDFNYTLPRNENKYQINLGNLPAGEYNYQLSARLKGELFQKKGVFYVRSHNPELNHLIADRMLLKELAENSGAQMNEAKELGNLVRILNGNTNLKPVYRTELKFMEMREMGFVGLILLLLLCTEWLLLKLYVG